MRRSIHLVTLLGLAAPLPQVLAEPISFGKPLEPARLEQLRAGTDTTVSDMRLNGTTAGNTASHVATGSNTITEGAFSHLNGIPLVVQNSGANVLIQNAVIVNLQMQ